MVCGSLLPFVMHDVDSGSEFSSNDAHPYLKIEGHPLGRILTLYFPGVDSRIWSFGLAPVACSSRDCDVGFVISCLVRFASAV